MLCLYCGADIPEEAVFCNRCGRRQNLAGGVSQVEVGSPAYAPTITATPQSPYMSSDSSVAQPPYSLRSTASFSTASHPALALLQQRRGLWIAFGIIAAVLLVGGIIIANIPSASKTLDNYCSALVNGDAQSAYNQLSPELQRRTPEALLAFALNFNKVTSCTHDTPAVSGNTATAHLMIDYASGRTQSNLITLVQGSGGSWEIDNITS